MTKAIKIRLGLFVVLAVVLSAIVVFMFAGFRFWESRDRYTVKFKGSVYGLQNGAQVFLNGVRVGSVEDIDVSSDLGNVDVTIAVKSGTPVQTDTHAMLQIAGITGLKVIDLRDGTRNAQPLVPGSQIPQGETVLDQLEQRAKALVDQSSQLIARANTVIDNLATVTDPKQFEAMASVMEQARIASKNLATATTTLDAMIAENRGALRDTIAAAGRSAASAQTVIDGQVAQLLANASDLVSQMKGVVTDNGGALRAAMADLRQASRSFKELSREVRQRPSRLLFSGTPADRKLP